MLSITTHQQLVTTSWCNISGTIPLCTCPGTVATTLIPYPPLPLAELPLFPLAWKGGPSLAIKSQSLCKHSWISSSLLHPSQARDWKQAHWYCPAVLSCPSYHCTFASSPLPQPGPSSCFLGPAPPPRKTTLLLQRFPVQLTPVQNRSDEVRTLPFHHFNFMRPCCLPENSVSLKSTAFCATKLYSLCLV